MIKPPLFLMACIAYAVGAGTASLQSAAHAQGAVSGSAEPLRDSCVILDNDYDIDDMMAIPIVLGNKHVAAIVQTEGYTLPEQAAPAVDQLVNDLPDRPDSRRVPVLVGGKQVTSPDLTRWPWLPFFRAMMNRSNGLIPSAPAPWDLDEDYPRKVANAVSNCKSVSILIIGAYTSFINYLPLVKHKIEQVVIMGRPIGDNSREPGRLSFNCSYDIEACRKSMPMLAELKAHFIDIPRFTDCHDTANPPGHCYTPSFHMVAGNEANASMMEGLLQTGLPGRLRRALINDVQCSSLYTTSEAAGRTCGSLSTWEPAAVASGPGGEMLLWDQTAALFLVNPGEFTLYYPPADPKEGGKHHEPTLVNDSHEQTVQKLRRMWTEYTNRAVQIQ